MTRPAAQGSGDGGRGMFAELRDLIDSGCTCICKVCEATRIERSRLGDLLYGGAVPEAHEVFLAMHVLIAEADESDQDPLLRKLRLLVDSHVQRPPRHEVLAALEKLIADATRECEAEEAGEAEKLQ